METKELYEKKRRAQLDEWAAEIKKLKARASKAGADTRLELDRRIGELQRQIARGRTALAELADAGEEAWDDLRDRIDATWDEVEKRVKAALKKSDD